jgi:hypothetical protein
MYASIDGLLRNANVKFVAWPTDRKIFLTDANQLIGRYCDFREFRQQNRDYRGWHAHHILEKKDIERLGLRAAFPKYDDQLCVLLPPAAHARRINSIYPRLSPRDTKILVSEIRKDYRATYQMVGDYCGSSEKKISDELMRILDATLALAGL